MENQHKILTHSDHADFHTLALWPADRHPAAVYLARLSTGSRPTMLYALNWVAKLLTQNEIQSDHLNWPALRYQHVMAIRAVLRERYAVSTANKILCALRGVLRECWRLGYLPAEAYQQIADVTVIKGKTLLRGRALTEKEMFKLFETCMRDASPAGVRDAAMLAILFSTGLRRSEMVTLQFKDYHPQTQEIFIRHGKGNRARIVYASKACTRFLQGWLAIRGETEGALFVPINKSGKLSIRKMTDQTIINMIYKRAKEANVNRFSPHDLRRTFISMLLDAGVDIVTVQNLAGHASVQTTARYDRRGEAAKRLGVEKIPLPMPRIEGNFL